MLKTTSQKEMFAVYSAKLYFNNLGFTILSPDNPVGYDFVIEKSGVFHRVQVKYSCGSKHKAIPFSEFSVQNMDVVYLVYEGTHFVGEKAELALVHRKDDNKNGSNKTFALNYSELKNLKVVQKGETL